MSKLTEWDDKVSGDRINWKRRWLKDMIEENCMSTLQFKLHSQVCDLLDIEGENGEGNTEGVRKGKKGRKVK